MTKQNSVMSPTQISAYCMGYKAAMADMIREVISYDFGNMSETDDTLVVTFVAGQKFFAEAMLFALKRLETKDPLP